jgi:CRISPR-associated endonuclease/helicase Cas3
MAQVAGRCNRDGNLGERGGTVVIFDPADGGMPPSYRTQIDKASGFYGPDKADPENVEALRDYFPALYRTLGIEDRGRAAWTIKRNRRRWDFEAVADGPFEKGDSNKRNRELAFRMITEDTVPVVVPYDDPGAEQLIAECLARLRSPHPNMTALRRLQPYITSLRRSTTQQAAVATQLDLVVGDLHVWLGDYDDGYGIVLEPRGEDFLL